MATANIPNTIDIFSTYTMRAQIKLIKPEYFFFKTRYFPTGADDIFDSDKVLVEYTMGSRKMAPFVGERLDAPTLERGGYGISELQPAEIKIGRPLKLDDLKKRGFGEALFVGSTPAQRALKIQRNDLIELNDSITRREEWMCVETMKTNACVMQEYVDKVTVGEKKYVKFFDSETENGHLYTVANTWNSASANIIQDVAAMGKILAARGLNAADLVIGPDVEDVFYTDPIIGKMLDKNSGINFGVLDEKIEYPGVSFLGKFNYRGFKLNTFVVSESYEDDNGVDTPYFPKDAAMVTFPNCGHLMYGRITQMKRFPSDQYETIAAARVPRLDVDTHRETRELVLKAHPLAAPHTYAPYIYAPNVVS